MVETIAGHTFVSRPNGRDECSCGKTWVDIAPATEDDIKKEGWAHSGSLTEFEYKQIVKERERRWDVGMGVTRKKEEV